MLRLMARQEPDTWKARFLEYRFLPMILVLSLTLNLWGNRWGAPQFWHPDEVIRRSISMVFERTLNPHHFAYGGLHYSLVAAGAIIPVAVYDRIFDPKPSRLNTPAHAQWEERHLVRIIQVARSISAVMSTLIVGITFIIGAVLFDRRVGYLAALFLAVSMSFVAIAHFATVDAPANLWYWLSCLSALFIWKRGDRIWYILAAITAGLAIATKIDRAVILLPLLLSALLRREGLRFWKLLTCAALVALSFLLANPALILNFFEFLDGFTRDLFFNFLLDQAGPTSYARMLGYMNSGLGPPLLAAALAGFAYALYDLARAIHPPGRIVWLLATFVPYMLVFLSKPRINIWYIPLLFPPLTILAAYVCIAAASALSRPYSLVIRSLIAGIAVYSFLHTVALVLQFSRDSRYEVAGWITHHVPEGATIEILSRAKPPGISNDRYRIIDSPPEKESRDPDVRTLRTLERHHAYERVRQAILGLERWAGRRFGLPVRDVHYRAWFDRIAAHHERLPDAASRIVGIQTRRPDYLVIGRHKQRRIFAALRLPNSGYRLAATFRYVNPFGMQPSFPFVNPYLYMFQREANRAQPQWNLRGNPAAGPRTSS